MEQEEKSSSPTTPTPTDEEYGCFSKLPRVLHIVSDLRKGSFWRVSTCHSHEVVLIKDAQDSNIVVAQNQRLAGIVMLRCRGVKLQMLDSGVLTSRTFRMVDCTGCEVVFEDVDVRKVEMWAVEKCRVAYTSVPSLLPKVRILWRGGCAGNELYLTEMVEDALNHLRIQIRVKEQRAVPDCAGLQQFVSYFDDSQHIHSQPLVDSTGSLCPSGLRLLLSLRPFLLRVLPSDRLEPDHLPSKESILSDLAAMEADPPLLTKAEVSKALDDERLEFEESEAEVSRKVKEVAKLVQEGKHVVFYSGAGISTSANIPDFRGPEGVWTLKDKGKLLEEGKIIPIDQIKPTYAHYAITHLLRKRWVHFVITTNMDALHLRSGTPPHLLIEQHGNSFKEICSKCKMTFLRSYMVTETVEDPRVHTTGRRCTFCGGELMDTIVHFSEAFRGMHDEVISLYHARKADVAVVMGTSMNVQPNASFPDLCFQNEGKLVIVNLQKTPYDNVAAVRVFARTDVFMRKLMEEMKEEEFDRETDLRETWDGDGSAGGSEDGSCIIS